jgi:hypothetical protein
MGDGKEATRWQLWPEPSSENPPREAYDETILWNAAVVEDATILLSTPTPYDFVSTATSLNKHLLLQLHPSNHAGRWLFIGISLKRLPRTWTDMKVTLDSFVASVRCARSSLWCNGEKIGVLDFAWKSEP